MTAKNAELIACNDKLSAEISTLKQDKAAFEAESIKLMETVSNERLKFAQELEEVNKANNRMISDIKRKDSALNELQTNVNFLIENKNTSTSELSLMRSQLACFKKAHAQSEKSRLHGNSKIEELERELAELKCNMESMSRRNESLTAFATQFKHQLSKQQETELTICNLNSNIIQPSTSNPPIMSGKKSKAELNTQQSAHKRCPETAISEESQSKRLRTQTGTSITSSDLLSYQAATNNFSQRDQINNIDFEQAANNICNGFQRGILFNISSRLD